MNQNSNSAPLSLSEGDSDCEVYEVEQIVSKRVVSGSPQYLVKWKGFESYHNTWEPMRHLTNVAQDLRAFEEQLSRHSKKQGSNSRMNYEPKSKREQKASLRRIHQFEKIEKITLRKRYREYKCHIRLKNGKLEVWDIQRAKKEIPLQLIDHLLELAYKYT